MVKYCVLKNCKTVWNPLVDVGFHSFPRTNEDLLAKWIASIPRELLPRWTDNSNICSKHFEKNCYESGCIVRRQLKKDAVPTIFKCSDEDDNLMSKINLGSLQQPGDSNQSVTSSNNIVFHNDIPDLRTIRKIDVAVQVESRYLPVSPDKAKLKRDIKVLQQRLRRRNEALTSLKLLVAQLKMYQGIHRTHSE
ncbi:PREDICTED: THAP domain-containing protein 1-like [Dinoponera quadriceps]|uniref:THAP domain-containing protein 1-like n=1 Tax=Dinoponera quadriceps TaxID=609295 RepID=A0A6P3XAH0_DINQU|nr:PREDICTED: THAP domain-containing protein 1-like [Dinoponera quadriceps]